MYRLRNNLFAALPDTGRYANERSSRHLQIVPRGDRTHNLQLRRLTLYPIELRDHLHNSGLILAFMCCTVKREGRPSMAVAKSAWRNLCLLPGNHLLQKPINMIGQCALGLRHIRNPVSAQYAQRQIV